MCFWELGFLTFFTQHYLPFCFQLKFIENLLQGMLDRGIYNMQHIFTYTMYILILNHLQTHFLDFFLLHLYRPEGVRAGIDPRYPLLYIVQND